MIRGLGFRVIEILALKGLPAQLRLHKGLYNLTIAISPMSLSPLRLRVPHLVWEDWEPGSTDRFCASVPQKNSVSKRQANRKP